jgi:hypothetical protein
MFQGKFFKARSCIGVLRFEGTPLQKSLVFIFHSGLLPLSLALLLHGGVFLKILPGGELFLKILSVKKEFGEASLIVNLQGVELFLKILTVKIREEGFQTN